MKDFIKDLVDHTSGLGCIETVKITCDGDDHNIEGVSDDKTVILKASIHNPVDGFDGVFGITNISKLSAIINLEPYKEDELIELQTKKDSDGVKVPSNLHFENSEGTFKNDHRFMSTEYVNEKLRAVKFKKEITDYDVVITPTMDSVKLMGYQSAISDELTFAVKTDDKGVSFLFGDHSTHAGEFVFHPSTDGKLKNKWSWFVSAVLPILKLSGNTTMSFSDHGMLKITVDSGLCEYNYFLPGMNNR